MRHLNQHADRVQSILFFYCRFCELETWKVQRSERPDCSILCELECSQIIICHACFAVDEIPKIGAVKSYCEIGNGSNWLIRTVTGSWGSVSQRWSSSSVSVSFHTLLLVSSAFMLASLFSLKPLYYSGNTTSLSIVVNLAAGIK